MAIIIIMLIFLNLRKQTHAPLPPELKTLIDRMPSSPSWDKGHPGGGQAIVRRNSISGPATPSKKLVETLPSGGALQRFRSETTLGVHGLIVSLRFL